MRFDLSSCPIKKTEPSEVNGRWSSRVGTFEIFTLAQDIAEMLLEGEKRDEAESFRGEQQTCGHQGNRATESETKGESPWCRSLPCPRACQRQGA